MGSAATEESSSVAERRRRGVFEWEGVLVDLFIVYKAKMGKIKGLCFPFGGNV